MADSEMNASPRKRHWVRWGAIIVLLVSAIALVNYAGQTDWIPQMVDFARSLPFVGPDRVATMENIFYSATDSVNQFIYDHTHGPIVVASEHDQHLSVTGVYTASTPAPTPPPAGTVAIHVMTPSPAARVTPTYKSPSPIPPLILSDPQAGEGVWTTSNMPLGGQPNPPIWHTFFRPDPDRPYARAFLVWIDLHQTGLTMVQGTVEPRPTDGVAGTGQIPLTVQQSGKLLAAWNGGFLTLHGAYGMMVNRRVIAPPRDGFGVLAQYADGSLRIGTWGKEITMTPDLVSFRQNGPMLIDHGIVNQDESLTWGKSVSGGTRIWRSGIGLTADNELIYGLGDSLSAQTLGEAMWDAGAVEAIELDVNAWHAFFFTYQLTPDGLVGAKLEASIPGPSVLYLRPYGRDFMYLTLKQ